MFVPNFKIIGAVAPENPLTQFSLCIYIGVRDGKKEKGKKKAK